MPCFQSQMEALMFIIPQIFFVTPTVLKIGGIFNNYYSESIFDY